MSERSKTALVRWPLMLIATGSGVPPRTMLSAAAMATFSDVPTSHPFCQYIEALAASGITGGCQAPAALLPEQPGDASANGGLPCQGARAALVLEGDPSKAGPLTLRLKFPDGYKIAPHWHPGIEHVTVVSGTFNLGLGDKFDDSKGSSLPAGSFGYLAPRMHHFAWTKGETEIQVHTIAPWKLVYVDPADDPSKKK